MHAMTKPDGDTLRTLLLAAERYATQKLDLIPDEQRAAIAAAITRGCTIELRIAPMSRRSVQLVLIGGAQEIELGHLQNVEH